MAIQDTEELFDESGCIPVWGHTSASGKPYYTFKLTNKDSYIIFPCTINKGGGVAKATSSLKDDIIYLFEGKEIV